LEIKSVWPALRRLEKAGFLGRQKHYRNSNEYLLLIPPVSENEGVTQPLESTRLAPRFNTPNHPKRHPDSINPNGTPAVSPFGTPAVSPFGTPPSVPMEVSPKGSVCEGTPTHLWPAAIPEAAANRIAGKHQIPVAEVFRMYGDFRLPKLTYHDPPPESEVDLLEQFEGYVITHIPKRTANSRAHPQTDVTATGPPAGLPEPPGWREVAAANDDLKWLANDQWATINPFYQRRVIEAKKQHDAAKT
jgi:hypothetical protein